MGRPVIDILGQHFGTFTVIQMGEYANHKRLWIIKCDKCGTEKTMAGPDIRRYSKSRGDAFGEGCKGCLEKRRACLVTHRICTGPCKRMLPRECFYVDKHHSDGCSAWCKDCHRDYMVRKPPKVIKSIYNSAKKRAKQKGWMFDITHDFIRELNNKQNGRCAYTNIELNWDSGDRNGPTIKNVPINRASLDRIDSSKGYTKDNVQLVTSMVNFLKNNASEQDFLETCQTITNKAIASGKLLPNHSASVEACDSLTASSL